MSRKVFDILTSTGGAVIVVVLVIAGGLLTWGHSYANSNVRDQLAQQQIFFPPKAAFAHPKAGTEITPSMIRWIQLVVATPDVEELRCRGGTGRGIVPLQPERV